MRAEKLAYSLTGGRAIDCNWIEKYFEKKEIKLFEFEKVEEDAGWKIIVSMDLREFAETFDAFSYILSSRDT